MSGDASGAATVVLARDVELPIRGPGAVRVRIDTPSSFGGFALVRRSAGEAVGVRAFKGVLGSPERLDVIGAPAVTQDGTAVRLPAGEYRLYLVASSPTSVQLTVPSTDGRLDVVPRDRIDVSHVDLPAWRGDAGVLGATGQVEAGGLLLLEMKLDGELNAYQRLEVCVYPPEGAPGDDAFGPGCPGGRSAELTNLPDPPMLPSGIGASWMVEAGQGGTWGIGGNAGSVGASSQLSGTGTWLDDPSRHEPPVSRWLAVDRVTRASRSRLRARVRCLAPAPCRARLRARPTVTRRWVRAAPGRASTIRLRRRDGRSWSARSTVSLRFSGRSPGGERLSLSIRRSIR